MTFCGNLTSFDLWCRSEMNFFEKILPYFVRRLKNLSAHFVKNSNPGHLRSGPQDVMPSVPTFYLSPMPTIHTTSDNISTHPLIFPQVTPTDCASCTAPAGRLYLARRPPATSPPYRRRCWTRRTSWTTTTCTCSTGAPPTSWPWRWEAPCTSGTPRTAPSPA